MPAIGLQNLVNPVLKSFPANKRGQSEFKNNLGWNGKMGVKLGFITLTGSDIYPYIYEVIQNSPAETAGVMKDDIVIKINGVDTKNIKMTELLGNTVVEPGDTVKLTLWRGGNNIREVQVRTIKP